MKRYGFRFVWTILVICSLQNTYACLWDYDTLAMEKRDFPEALDLITGKFLRHSTHYYQWRIKDRTVALEKDASNLSVYDDLAVAYDKTKQGDLAIEIILKKDALSPGLYETEANLGTFYIHTGQFDKGLKHIQKAIEINPDAHFGREIYQKLLVEYVISKQMNGTIQLPLSTEERGRKPGFAKFVLDSTMRYQGNAKANKRELEKAKKGVLGMMRFGHYDSPILLEALGDIMIAIGDAKRLASRAYLKASYEATDNEIKAAYREKARSILSMQTKHRFTTKQLTVSELEKTFQKELTDAKTWYAKIVADEKEWIARGANVDAEFAKRYYQQNGQD